MGHEAMMLDKIQKQNKIVRDGVRKLQSDAGTAPPDDEMGVSIGNTYTQTKPNGSFKTAAITAAMIGLPLLGAALTWFAMKPSPPDTDTNTKYEFSIGQPEPIEADQ